jgi:hypothetical protein
VHGGAVARRWAAQIEATTGRPAFARDSPGPLTDPLAGLHPGEPPLEARGESAVERVLSLVLLGDLVAVYLAALAGPPKP